MTAAAGGTNAEAPWAPELELLLCGEGAGAWYVAAAGAAAGELTAEDVPAVTPTPVAVFVAGRPRIAGRGAYDDAARAAMRGDSLPSMV